MAFLAPAFLALAVLAGVPLLVHLLRRRVGRVVDFPAVRYLARMEQEHSRERKVRHRLLLLLRLLAVLALAFAAARPITRLAGLGHAPVAVALVIDNSMSSGAVHDGRAVIDDLRADATQLLASLTPEDRAWIVTADGRVVGGSESALAQALAQVKPLGGRGDIAAAARRAVTLAQSGAPRAPVVAIVTDGQASAWQQSASDSGAALRTDAADVPVRLLVHGNRALRNAAVLDVRAEPARWTPSGDVSFRLQSTDSAAWRVTLDGRTVARGKAAPGGPNDAARITQRLASAAGGWIRGSVELDADELRADDARWFAVRVAPPPSVAVRTEAGPFLTAALSTLVDEKRLARATAADRSAVTVAGADAVIASAPVLLTAPIDPVRVGDANRTLARLGIPWRFGALARDLVQAKGNPSLEGTQVRLRYPLQRAAGTGTSAAVDTMATAGGAPWAVAGDGYVLLASPLDPEATDLPLRAGFVPWLLDALSRRLGDDGRVLMATPGQHLIDRALATASSLERPDGLMVPLAGDRVTVPNESGVYFLRRQATRIGALVVNAEPEESDLRTESTAAGTLFRTRVVGKHLAVDTLAASWQRGALEQVAGRPLLTLLAALALLALLLEAWFSRGTAANAAASSATP